MNLWADVCLTTSCYFNKMECVSSVSQTGNHEKRSKRWRRSALASLGVVPFKMVPRSILLNSARVPFVSSLLSRWRHATKMGRGRRRWSRSATSAPPPNMASRWSEPCGRRGASSWFYGAAHVVPHQQRKLNGFRIKEWISMQSSPKVPNQRAQKSHCSPSRRP